MVISEVRVKLIPNPHDRLKAFASVTLDSDFVVRDIKVIDGAAGIFVAMPSRKLADRCARCKSKNHLRAKFCNECGESLAENRIVRDKRGRTKLHADIAHPINSECRQRLQERIVEAYAQEVVHSEEPGYQPVTDDEYDDATDAMHDETANVESDVNTGVESNLERGVESDVDTDVDSDAETGVESEVEIGVGPSAHPDVDETPFETADDADSLDEDDAVNPPAAEESGSDYNSLIADLKRDAAKRSSSRSRGGRSSPGRSRRADAGSKHQQPDERPEPAARQDRPRKPAAKPPQEPVTEPAAQPDDFGAGIV